MPQKDACCPQHEHGPAACEACAAELAQYTCVQCCIAKFYLASIGCTTTVVSAWGRRTGLSDCRLCSSGRHAIVRLHDCPGCAGHPHEGALTLSKWSKNALLMTLRGTFEWEWCCAGVTASAMVSSMWPHGTVHRCLRKICTKSHSPCRARPSSHSASQSCDCEKEQHADCALTCTPSLVPACRAGPCSHMYICCQAVSIMCAA